MGSTRASDSFVRFLSRPVSLVGFGLGSVPYLHELVRALLDTKDEGGAACTLAAVLASRHDFAGAGPMLVVMNEHRRSRLKRLAVGTALVGASLAAAQSAPTPKNVNSPKPLPAPAQVDAGTPTPVAAPTAATEPIRMNSPPPQKPPPLTLDAGSPRPTDENPTLNSPPPRKKK